MRAAFKYCFLCCFVLFFEGGLSFLHIRKKKVHKKMVLDCTKMYYKHKLQKLNYIKMGSEISVYHFFVLPTSNTVTLAELLGLIE